MRDNRLKKLLRAGEPALGFWAGSGSPLILEAMCQQKIDWILLDAEHGIVSVENIVPLLQAMWGHEPTSIVRLPQPDPGLVARLLDAGIEGFLAPRIREASEVEAFVAASRYPPQGVRGIGPFRATRFGADGRDYVSRVNDQIAVTVQIETKQALDSLDEILSVDGLDAALIGPSDLSAALGHPFDNNHAECEEAYALVAAKCREHGVAGGFYCDDGKTAHARLEQGFQFVSIASDMGAMGRALRRDLALARGDA